MSSEGGQGDGIQMSHAWIGCGTADKLDTVEQWKEHFEDLFNPFTMSTFEEEESEDQ